MKLKEKIQQLITDLSQEQVKYPRMKTADVIYMLEILLKIEEKPC